MKIKFKPGDVCMVVDNIETSYMQGHKHAIGSLVVVKWSGTENEVPIVWTENTGQFFPQEIENLGPL